MGCYPSQERTWQRALPERMLATSAAVELAPAVPPPGVHEVGMYWMAHPVPPFPDVHGVVPTHVAHGAKAETLALPNGFAQPPSGFVAQANGLQPALPPRRLVQSWAVYSEPGDGGQRGVSDATCAALRDYGSVDSQARSLQGLAEVVTQPSGRAAADAGQAHGGMPGLPRAAVRAAAEHVAAHPPAVAPLGQASMVPDEWAVGAGATVFMDVCDEEALGAFGAGGAGFGPGGGGAGFPDLPGVADESELAAVLGLLPPAAAQHAARLTAAGPRLIEGADASGGTAALERPSQVCCACLMQWLMLTDVSHLVPGCPAWRGTPTSGPRAGRHLCLCPARAWAWAPAERCASVRGQPSPACRQWMRRRRAAAS